MEKRKIKEEVRELVNTVRLGSTEEREKAMRVLERKYKFTAFSALALFYNPPVLEYTDENYSLIFDFEEG